MNKDKIIETLKDRAHTTYGEDSLYLLSREEIKAQLEILDWFHFQFDIFMSDSHKETMKNKKQELEKRLEQLKEGSDG